MVSKKWEQKFIDYGFLEQIEKEIRGECKRPEDWMLDYWKSDYSFDYAKIIIDRFDLPAGISEEVLKENDYSLCNMTATVII